MPAELLHTSHFYVNEKEMFKVLFRRNRSQTLCFICDLDIKAAGFLSLVSECGSSVVVEFPGP